MKTIYIRTTKIDQIFNKLNTSFGGNLEVFSNEFKLELNGNLGNGIINGITFKNGISYLEFDVTLKDTLILSLYSTKRLPIYFAYCTKGSLTHRFGDNDEEHVLNKFQTGILASKRAEESLLTFKKDEPTRISLIVVNTMISENVEGFSLNQKLRNVFFENNTKDSNVYIGSHNLKISEKIKELNAIKQTGIVRNLMMKGIVHLILAMEVQQRADDLNKLNNATGSLTKKELETVKEFSEFIVNYPENNFTLKFLSRKSGLSANKLQEGFKILHNRTVRDFIINERMKKSEELIRTTDLNISEIVYSIGFTSRSYFSKIFKQKYNCSPKFYKDSQNSLASTA